MAAQRLILQFTGRAPLYWQCFTCKMNEKKKNTEMTILRLAAGIVLVAHLRADIEVSPGPLEYRFEQASAVFRGLAIVERKCDWPEVNGKLQPADCSVTISVTAVYKGQPGGPKLTLRLPRVNPMTGLPVSDGQEYLYGT